MSGVDVGGVFTWITVVIAGGWAFYQWADTLAQRKREFRWKQTEAAFRLMDEVFDGDHTGDALLMIDGEKDEFEVVGGRPTRVGFEEIGQALRFDGSSDARDRFIRHRFDSLFYDLERLEHAIRVGLIQFQDITTPTGYYVRRLVPFREQVIAYAGEIGFHGALGFLDRFPAWTSAGNQVSSTAGDRTVG